MIGEPRERVANGHCPDLIKKPGLIEQRAREHHDVADGLAGFRQEKGAVKELAREHGREMANEIQRRYAEKRIVIQTCCVLVAVGGEALAKIDRSDEK